MEKKPSSKESGIESGQQRRHRLQSDNDTTAAEPNRENVYVKASQQQEEDSSPSSNETLESQAHSNQSALAASLPVAASFHPAELFESHPPANISTTGTFNRRIQNMLPPTGGEHVRTSSMLNATTEQALLLASSQQFSMMSRNLLPSPQESHGTAPNVLGYPQTGPLPFSSFHAQNAATSSEPSGMSIVSAALEHMGRRSHSATEHARHGTRRRSSEPEDPFLLSRLVTAASTNPTASSTAAHAGVASSLQNQEERALGRDLQATSKATRGEEVFPMTLHRLLIDLENVDGGTDIARFIDGKSFIVEDAARFESEIMPEYFPRMNRLSSFQRQLNLYNFRRVLGTGPDRGAYYHELFVRDKPDLASTIRRTKIKGRFTVPLEKRRNRKKQLESRSPSKSPADDQSPTGDGKDNG